MINRKYIRQNKNQYENTDKSKYSSLLRSAKIIIFTLLLSGIVIFAFVNPIILKTADFQGKIIVTQMLSDTISEVLESENINYQSIVNIERDTNQKITSIDTDMKTVNKIKNMIAKNIAQKFSNKNPQSRDIPLGSLLSNPLFTGRGPDIKVNVIPIGYLNSQLKSEFISGGINQTNHRIMLDVTVDYTLTLPLHKSKTTLETNFIIADTIIVGEVPEYYTNLSGENANDPGNIKTVYPGDDKP